MKRQISARRLWLTSFPIMVMAIMVVSMFCCHAVHGLLDAQFGIFPSLGFVTAFLQIGVAFFLLRRDKPLAGRVHRFGFHSDCFVSSEHSSTCTAASIFQVNC